MDCLLNEIRSWNQNIDLEMLPKDPLGRCFSYFKLVSVSLSIWLQLHLLTPGLRSCVTKICKNLSWGIFFITFLNYEQKLPKKLLF